jgi:hypothetical protein
VSTSLVDECYRRAREAGRSAEMASMPSQKTHFLELEQRWLLAAARVAPKNVRETKAPMTAAMAQPKIAKVLKGRPTKFTAERIEQIRNLVALGKSRDEIAGFLGVTVGSLQVTCSKLGISLRRRPLKPQLNLPRHDVPCSGAMISSPTKVNSVRFAFDVDQLLQGTQEKDVAAPRPDEIEDQQLGSTNLVLKMQYRGLEQAIPLRLSNEAITTLALEAQLRDIGLGQLVSTLIGGAIAKGVSQVLDGEPAGDTA